MEHNNEISKLNEKNNVYAYNVEYAIIHISKAKSGKRGYFCLGCKREMQGVISKKQNRISYFRHDPKAVKGKGKCTYSDETYRHNLAKEILQRTKVIKVPALYKYPPKGQEGKANFITDSKYVEAFKVGVERIFYEDKNGNICWDKNNEVSEKHLLFQPDVAFFDKNDKPILLIEIIATHGIKADKLVKIKRMGIDTIQVTVPKSSPEEIEKAFSNTIRTKWVYNYEQEFTEYISITDRDTTAISSIDEIQRRLFEENFSCRAAEIANLIRSIERCLESKLYGVIEGTIRSELQRIERNTASNRERLQELEDKYREELEGRYRGRREQLENEEAEFQEHFRDLEKRYIKEKKNQLEKTRIIEYKIEREVKKIEEYSNSFETKKREFEEKKERIGIATASEQQRRNRFGGQREKYEEFYKQEESDLTTRFKYLDSEERGRIKAISREEEQLPAKFAEIHRTTRDKFKRMEEEERRRIKEIQSDRNGLSEIFDRKGRKLENRNETLRKEADRSIKERDVGKGGEFSRDLKKLLKDRALLLDFEKVYNARGRNRKAWEAFRSGTYKDWNE